VTVTFWRTLLDRAIMALATVIAGSSILAKAVACGSYRMRPDVPTHRFHARSAFTVAKRSWPWREQARIQQR
jgi:hypothetical protein